MKISSLFHCLCFTIIFLSAKNLSAQCNCNPAENRAAVLEIERIMDVEDWDTLQPITNWKGLKWNSAGCLESLTFHNTKQSGKILDLIFKKLTCLIYLDLGGSGRINDILPASIKNMQQLKTLRSFASGIGGRIPPEIGDLTQLEILDINTNNINGVIPGEIGKLANLKELTLSGNLLSGSIPPEIGNLTNLKILWITDNRVSGAIPAEIGNLVNAEEVYLGFNQLSGSIPETIGNLHNVRVLWIAVSKVSGTIPVSIQNLKNLENCQLDGNELTGEIGTVFQNLPKLKYLNIGYNKLSGTIPPYLVDLPELNGFTVTNNHLTGIFPDFSSAAKLTNLGLDYNSFDSLPPIKRDAAVKFTITAQQNFFTFDDILPNLKYEIFQDHTQRPFFPDTTLLFAPCAVPSIYLNIDPGIRDNTYTWFKGEAVIYTTNQNVFHLDSVFQNPSQFPGSYTCQVSNPAAKVVLQSGIINIAFSDKIPFQPDTVLVRDTLCFGKRRAIAANIWADCYNRDTVLHFVSPFTACDSIIRVQLVCNTCSEEPSIPTAFTPNNDAWNDTFEIPMLLTEPTRYVENELRIYNRYKQLVYRQKNYRNDWNGVDDKNNPLPAGTYFYTFQTNGEATINGMVTIIR